MTDDIEQLRAAQQSVTEALARKAAAQAALDRAAEDLENARANRLIALIATRETVPRVRVARILGVTPARISQIIGTAGRS